MRPLHWQDVARPSRAIDFFAIVWRRNPDDVLAVVARQTSPSGRKSWWTVEKPASRESLLDGRCFGCRQVAFKTFMAEGGGWANALSRADKILALHRQNDAARAA
jgi:hypothetical protein